MALPQKVIEQLGREPARTPGWSGRLLMFSSTMCFIALGVWVGISFGYEPYLDAQLQKIRDQKAAMQDSITPEQRTQVFSFYSQLANAKKILDGHVLPSRLFDWLEKNTQANIFYTKLEYKRDGSGTVVKLAGTAKTVNDFVEQVKHLEAQPEVRRVAFKELRARDKSWDFSGEVSFAPDIFTQNEPLLAPADNNENLPPVEASGTVSTSTPKQ